MHCIDRAYERYGLELTPQEIGHLCYLVREGKATKVRKRHGKCVQYCLYYRGKLLHLIYSRSKKIILTFLPAHGN